jgi:hypothetical protein
LNSQHVLGKFYADAGRPEKAEPLLALTLDARRKKLGTEHPDTVITQSTLADFYQTTSEYAKAEPLYAGLVEIQRRKHGQDDPQTASSLAQLSLNLLAQQKYAVAELPLRECLKIRTEKMPDDWATFNAKSLLGGSLLGQKKYAEAEPLLLEGYNGMQRQAAKIPATAKIRLNESLERIGHLYDAWGKPDQAAEWRAKLNSTNP